MYSLTDITQPIAEPVSLALAKQHLRVDDDSEDALIEMWITAARQYVEKVIRKAIFEREVVLTLDTFPLHVSETLTIAARQRSIPQVWDHYTIYLPKPRVQSITSITYQYIDGTEITLDPSLYRSDFNNHNARVVPAPGMSWPYQAIYVPGTVKIQYVTGCYGDGVEVNTCPSTLIAAILLLVGHYFENREASSQGVTVSTVPMAVDSLLNTEKVSVLGFRQ